MFSKMLPDSMPRVVFLYLQLLYLQCSEFSLLRTMSSPTRLPHVQVLPHDRNVVSFTQYADDLISAQVSTGEVQWVRCYLRVAVNSNVEQKSWQISIRCKICRPSATVWLRYIDRINIPMDDAGWQIQTVDYRPQGPFRPPGNSMNSCDF